MRCVPKGMPAELLVPFVVMEEVGERVGPDRATIAAFIAMVVTIGGNAVAFKLVLLEPDLGPLWAAASRFLLAAPIFTLIAGALRTPLPRGRALVGALLYGAFTFGAFLALCTGACRRLLPGSRGSSSQLFHCSPSSWRSPRARNGSAGIASPAERSPWAELR